MNVKSSAHPRPGAVPPFGDLKSRGKQRPRNSFARAGEGGWRGGGSRPISRVGCDTDTHNPLFFVSLIRRAPANTHKHACCVLRMQCVWVASIRSIDQVVARASPPLCCCLRLFNSGAHTRTHQQNAFAPESLFLLRRCRRCPHSARACAAMRANGQKGGDARPRLGVGWMACVFSRRRAVAYPRTACFLCLDTVAPHGVAAAAAVAGGRRCTRTTHHHSRAQTHTHTRPSDRSVPQRHALEQPSASPLT